MGEATPRDDVEQIPALSAEVDALRERTQTLVSELERRLRQRLQLSRATVARVRHAIDVRAQIEEHPAAVIGVGAITSALLGVGIYFVVVRVRRSRQPLYRWRARLAAYRLLLREPERALRKHPPLGRRLLAAVLIAGATTLMRSLSALLVKRAITRRQLPA
jgi:ElaB/YqjD/DUF883 family membrane-anchored ribosome-binding protein